MSIIRVKLRCMQVARHWNGCSTAELAPVRRDGRDGENDRFWEATPSGKLELLFSGPAMCWWRDGSSRMSRGLAPGDYYHLDLAREPEARRNHPSQDELWHANAVVWSGEGGGRVELVHEQFHLGGLRRAHLWLNLQRREVVDLFSPPTNEAERCWRVSLRWAEASDSLA